MGGGKCGIKVRKRKCFLGAFQVFFAFSTLFTHKKLRISNNLPDTLSFTRICITRAILKLLAGWESGVYLT